MSEDKDYKEAFDFYTNKVVTLKCNDCDNPRKANTTHCFSCHLKLRVGGAK